MAYYLLDAKPMPEGMKLTLIKSSNGSWEEFWDTNYTPYFYVPHPLSQADETNIVAIDAKTRIEQKVDLFTGQVTQVTRVECSDIKNVSRQFDKTWEDRVSYPLGYVYDKGLVFGAQHSLQDGALTPVFVLPEETRTKFEATFFNLKKTDPQKYLLLKRWFYLCAQPIPQINLEKLGIERMTPEQRYRTFLLARIANLPVPQAYSTRHVSSWIRSILHNHLRRNNILIPTSKELRRNEIKRSIEGALTFPPEPGVHFNTVVVDFESLYPSLIDVNNLSYETVNCSHNECQKNKVPGLDHYVCTCRRGIYSVLIGSIKDLRIHWYKPLAKEKQLKKEERILALAVSQLLKLILVSSYGVTVRIHGLARPSLAESITAYGRYTLQKTRDMAKNCGMHPIYGDTDSLFLANPTADQVERLIKMVKLRFRLDLAVDEQYSVCVLPRAMKAYFGIRRDGTPDIKGVTAIKSNSPHFIQKAFQDCVSEMGAVQNQADFEKAKGRIQNVVKNAITNLTAGKVRFSELEYRVRLNEDPASKVHDKVLHQPYQCALQLIRSGQKVQKGDTVHFVKVNPFQHHSRTFTVKPSEWVRTFSEINVDDYIRNLRTALNQIFKVMDIEFKEKDETVTLSDFL